MTSFVVEVKVGSSLGWFINRGDAFQYVKRRGYHKTKEEGRRRARVEDKKIAATCRIVVDIQAKSPSI